MLVISLAVEPSEVLEGLKSDPDAVALRDLLVLCRNEKPVLAVGKHGAHGTGAETSQAGERKQAGSLHFHVFHPLTCQIIQDLRMARRKARQLTALRAVEARCGCGYADLMG